MFSKVISVIMSLIMSVSGFVYSSFATMVDTVSEMLFGIPYTFEAVKSDFFEEIEENDVVTVDSDSGFVKDMVVVFIDSSLSFSERLSLFGRCGGAIAGWCTPADLFVLRYSPMNFEQMLSKCESLNSIDGVALAIPVSTYRTTVNATPNDSFDESEGALEWDELNPNGSNWWLEAVQARQAWDYEEYFSKINIGVIDSGFQIDHPELEGKITFPSDKLANRNYPDEHGTHVAGIIAAEKNNGIGIAGICSNSELICVDWQPEILQFWNTELAIFFGFSSAVKAGAKAVNFSLGISGSRPDNSYGFWDDSFNPAALSLMMSSLLSKGYDFLAVQSAGNGDYYGDPMDASLNGHFAAINEGNIFTGFYDVSAEDILDRIIIVASAKNDGDGTYTQSQFSNVGRSVTLAAPGSNVYSCSSHSDYTTLSGTSMSTPVVTGVASLVWSVNPSFTGADVKDILCSSTESFAEINKEYEYYYDVDLVDYPMVNAKLSVEEAIRRTDSSVGTVSGRIIGDASEIVFDGVSHTVFSDGSYSFVAREGSGIARVLDSAGSEIGSFDMSVAAGVLTDAGEYTVGAAVDPEPDSGVQIPNIVA